MRSFKTDIQSGGEIWNPQFYTEIEEDLFVEFPCQGMVGRYGTTEWCFPVREILELVIEAMRQEDDQRAEWLHCLAESFYGSYEPQVTCLKDTGLDSSVLEALLERLVQEREATADKVLAGKFLIDEWGTALHAKPPTTIEIRFPCRKLVKSDEDTWTFPARWVLKLIEADLLRRNDPEATDFRELVAYFYPEVQPAFWSTIGAFPS